MNRNCAMLGVRHFILLTVVAIAGCRQPDAAHTGDVPERIGTATLSIGELEGPPEYTFGRVSGVAEDPDGLIYVADALESTIRVFDGDGRFVRTIGRRGEGPGELQRPCCIAFGPSGDLWVRDSGNRRYTSYDISQEPPRTVATVHMVHFDGGLYAPTTFTSAGRLIDVGHSSGADGKSELSRFTVAPNGEQLERVPIDEPSPEALGTVSREQTIPGGVATFFFPQPYGPRSLVAHGPRGRWATALSSEYSVTLHVDSTVVAIQGPISEGPPLSSDENDRAAEQIRAYVERGGGAASDYPPVPDHKTQLLAIYFDAAGRLWVELSVPQGDPRRADVYEAAGTLLERRVWPSDVDLRVPAWVGESEALGIASDSLGVQRVVKIEFEK